VDPTERRTNFEVTVNLNDLDDDGEYSSQQRAVGLIFAVGIVIAVVINFINLHADFQDLHDFYRGYVGRRMLISEGKLTSRDFLNALRTISVAAVGRSDLSCKIPNGAIQESSNFAYPSSNTSVMSNSLEDILATTVSAQKGHGASNLGAFAAVGPLISDDEEWGDMYVRVERLLHLVPLYATAFIEDDDPEWRNLDYSIEVGDPPTTLWEFVRQYDWNITSNFCAQRNDPEHVGERGGLYAEMDETDLDLRQNLLSQFRRWKRRRRRLWKIVVTERAKRDMAAQDDMDSGDKGKR